MVNMNDNEQPSGTLTPTEMHNALTEFAVQRKRELDLEQEKLALRKQELEHSNAQALKSMDLHATDRREERAMWSKMYHSRLWWFLGFGVLAVASVMGLIYAGQPKLAEDVIKFGGGILFGYIAGKNTKKKSQGDTEAD